MLSKGVRDQVGGFLHKCCNFVLQLPKATARHLTPCCQATQAPDPLAPDPLAPDPWPLTPDLWPLTPYWIHTEN